MELCIRNGNVLIDGEFKRQDVYIDDGKIIEIGTQRTRAEQEFDADGQYVIPGFIDIHTHGATGVDVNHADYNDLNKISEFFATQGTTGWLASVLTDTEEKTIWCIEQITRAMKSSSGAQLLGIHLEGPFLAPAYKGAMPEHLLKKPDINLLKKYHKVSNGAIKYITVSPEIEGVPEIISEIVNLGIVVALGHTGADYDTAMKCIENGASSATHTFNAMKLLHQHAPAIMGAVLESDIYCEAICDGRHLHPGVVRLLIKTKGLDRVVAVTDSIMAAGLPDGNYVLGVNDVVVVDGDAKLVSDGTRAGSTLTTIKALKNLIDFTGRKLEELLPLLTSNPASLLKIENLKGTISKGKDADLVIIDSNLEVSATIVSGSIVYQK